MKVRVIDIKTGEIVREIEAGLERNAERLERGLLMNMNRDKYYTEIVP